MQMDWWKMVPPISNTSLYSIGVVSISQNQEFLSKKRKSMLNVYPWKYRKPEPLWGWVHSLGRTLQAASQGCFTVRWQWRVKTSSPSGSSPGRGWSGLGAHFLSRPSHHVLFPKDSVYLGLGELALDTTSSQANCLSRSQKMEASYYDNITEQQRLEPEFFRVGFYGRKFPFFLRVSPFR